MRAEPRFRPLPLEAVALLGEGRLAEAIKLVRTTEGLGLREARRRIEEHLDKDPLLRVQIETQRRATRRKYFFWFLIIDIVFTAAIIYWLFYRVPT